MYLKEKNAIYHFLYMNVITTTEFLLELPFEVCLQIIIFVTLRVILKAMVKKNKAGEG